MRRMSAKNSPSNNKLIERNESKTGSKSSHEDVIKATFLSNSIKHDMYEELKESYLNINYG